MKDDLPAVNSSPLPPVWHFFFDFAEPTARLRGALPDLFYSLPLCHAEPFRKRPALFSSFTLLYGRFGDRFFKIDFHFPILLSPCGMCCH